MYGDKTPGSPTDPAFIYPWDYYRIRLVSVRLSPTWNTFTEEQPIGSTIIDKDGNILVIKQAGGGWDIDPYGSISSRKTWNPNKVHKRVFVPKPTLASTSSSGTFWSNWFTAGRRNPWLNCKNDTITWYGMGMSMRNPTNNQHYPVIGTITFYIQFGQFIGF